MDAWNLSADIKLTSQVSGFLEARVMDMFPRLERSRIIPSRFDRATLYIGTA
jgi:hypothetical protein